MGGKVLEYEAKTIKREGIKQGIEQGIQALIQSFQELGIPSSKAQEQLMKQYSLTENIAQEYMQKF